MDTLTENCLNDYQKILAKIVDSCKEKISGEAVKEKADFVRQKLANLSEDEQQALNLLRCYDDTHGKLEIDNILGELQCMDSWIAYYQACIHINYVAKHICL